MSEDQIVERENRTIKRAMSIIKGRMLSGSYLTNSDSTRDYLKLSLGCRQSEVFCVVFLSNQHQVITCEDLFTGTIDGAAVYPREVVKRALILNAAAVVLAHNHPSGVSEPSHADIAITRRLRQALETVDIRVLDHLVIGGGTEITSFAERGLI